MALGHKYILDNLHIYKDKNLRISRKVTFLRFSSFRKGKTPQKMAKGAVFVNLAQYMPQGTLLGLKRAPFGTQRGPFWPLLGLKRALFGPKGAILAPFEPQKGPFWAPNEPLSGHFPPKVALWPTFYPFSRGGKRSNIRNLQKARRRNFWTKYVFLAGNR